MSFVIQPWDRESLPVSGGGRFPIRRVFCVGRNYAAHAREMGHDPDREPPFFFTKPAHAVVADGGSVPYPPATRDFHHEVELVLAIGHGGANIPATEARTCIWGYAVGIDLTRRDLQGAAKKAGRPWDMGKGFDASAPVGTLMPADRWDPADEAVISLHVGGHERQHGTLGEMIWPIDNIVAELSGLVTIEPGDLIMTGTPEGVGPLSPGDTVEAHIDGLPPLSVSIV